MKKFLTLILLSLSLTAQSRDIPAELVGKTITVIVPFGPGGNSDITARQLSKTVEKITGLHVIVSNRPGASGVIGTHALAQATPNGLTLGQFDTGPAMVNTIQGLPNSPMRDQLVPVSASTESSLALIVSADTPVSTVQEFVVYLQQQKQLNYATVGGVQTLMTEALLETTRVQGIQSIIYKSQADTLRSVAAKETSFVLSAIGDAQGLIDAKLVKVLAVGSRVRSAQHPNIPALAEIYNGFVTVNYNGVFAPRGTPTHILEYLNWAWNRATVDPETAAAIIHRGNVPLGGDLSQARLFYNTYYTNREQLYKKYQHLLSK
jgi:tripartite-type tricarboxylate transporter receptor subunit TctC